jgi:flavin reductase (DIM6/NTAB) family NADH-FMN oxidoreductase RutF
MTVTADTYRAALRRHPAGVAIITMMADTGPVGFTATSLASLSLDPPLVCFNITHTSSSIAALRQAATLVVHILGAHQLDTARRFSRSAEHRFADSGSWSRLDTGEPLLNGTPTWMKTTVHQLIPFGDSTLVIARADEIHCDDRDGTPPPLIYHDGGFTAASPVSR